MMTKKIVAIVVAVLLVVAVLAACTTTETTTESSEAVESAAESTEAASEAASEEAEASETVESTGLVFGYLAYNLADIWNQYGMEAFEWCADNKGVEVRVLDATNDPEKQVTQAQEFIDAGVDGISIFPCTPEAAATIVRMANEAGIPIAVENIFLDDEAAEGVVGQVACQYRDIGYAAIEYAATTYPGCKLLYVHGAPGLGVYEDYKIGVDAALEEYADSVEMVGLINGEWATEPAQNVTQDFITSGQAEFDVVFANNDLEAKGVYNALKDNGMEDIPIISTGGSPDGYSMLLDGIESANMTAPVNIQGEYVFSFLWQAVNDVEIADNKIPLPIIPVGVDNLDDWIAWDDFEAAYEYIGGIEP